MTQETPPIVAELFAQNSECTTTLAEPLKRLVLAKPEYIDDAYTALQASLTRLNNDGGSVDEVRSVVGALVEIIPIFPDAATEFQEPIERMTAHQDGTHRVQAYRCLGILGAVEPTDTARVLRIVANGLTDQNESVRTAALWSLTKLGLKTPERLTPIRERICSQFRTEVDGAVSGRRNIYAAEALAANARGPIEVDRYAPEGRLTGSKKTKQAAAWAIQRTATKLDIDHTTSERVFVVTDLGDDHLLVNPLVNLLKQQVSEADPRLAAASTFAVGYLTAGNPELREASEYLQALIKRGETQTVDDTNSAEELLTVLDLRHGRSGPESCEHIGLSKEDKRYIEENHSPTERQKNIRRNIEPEYQPHLELSEETKQEIGRRLENQDEMEVEPEDQPHLEISDETNEELDRRMS